MKNAIIAALVSALVSASAGVAATKYVITSTSQIAPFVLRKLEKQPHGATPAAPLEGREGPRGLVGERGVSGQSITGPAGSEGAAGQAGPSGQSIVGPEGARGERGLQGERGPAGTPAVNAVTTYESQQQIGYDGSNITLEARCLTGAPVSGGWESNGQEAGLGRRVIVSSSHRTATGWTITALNIGENEPATVTAFAYCA
jgi:hypothetical protein